MRKMIWVCLFYAGFFANLFELNIAPNFDKIDYERPIVVCIPSYKNQAHCIACLESVFSQNYSNFRVIYIDDASPDRTYELVKNYIYENNLSDKIHVIHNDINRKMLPNHYLMGHLCEDNEIIVSLDGDDKFYHENALKRINAAYMDPDVWVTYGQFKEEGAYVPHKPRPLMKYKLHPQIIRKLPFMFMQPRTYYAGLFKQIPREYFLNHLEFYETAGDVAIMTFLIDLAREHTYFIPEEIYSYNNDTAYNEYRFERDHQLNTEKLILTTKPLPKAEAPY